MQAGSRLYARRLRGDIGPIGVDPRTRRPGAILAPAVSLTGADQYYDQASDVQNFTLGSRMVVDERAFRYAKAGGLLDPQLGSKSPYPQIVAQRAVANAAPGAISIVVTVANPDGILGTGEIGVNELADGYIVIFPTAPARAINRRIIANTGIAAPGGAITVTLDRPIPVALGAAAVAELTVSQYLDVLSGDIGAWYNEYSAVVGMATLAATINQYVWLQTWGPLWISPQAGVSIGINNRKVVFRFDGSLEECTAANGATEQHAGYVMSQGRGPGLAQAAPFVFLQITP